MTEKWQINFDNENEAMAQECKKMVHCKSSV